MTHKLSRVNLAAHVAAKEDDMGEGRKGLAITPQGVASTDGRVVFVTPVKNPGSESMVLPASSRAWLVNIMRKNDKALIGAGKASVAEKPGSSFTIPGNIPERPFPDWQKALKDTKARCTGPTLSIALDVLAKIVTAARAMKRRQDSMIRLDFHLEKGEQSRRVYFELISSLDDATSPIARGALATITVAK